MPKTDGLSELSLGFHIQEVLAERLSRWSAPEPKIKKGWLARYAKVVTSAHTGAITTAD